MNDIKLLKPYSDHIPSFIILFIVTSKNWRMEGMVEGSHFHIHPVHDHYYDIMLLRLDEPVKCAPSVRPICLPDPRSMKVKTKYPTLFTLERFFAEY